MSESKLAIETTKDGSTAKVCGGQIGVNEKGNEVDMPYEASNQMHLSNRAEDFSTIPLIPDKTADKTPDTEISR